MTKAAPVTRFAPSPTGRLHVGNLRTALLTWLVARQGGGRFLLRLDDTDAERSTEAFAQAILEDLRRLGLEPDAVFRQSERVERYEQALGRLHAAGHVYPAWETAEELEVKRRLQLAAGRPPVYDRAALALDEAERRRLEAEGRRPHWRFRLSTDLPSSWHDGIRGPSAISIDSLSDPVIRREDGSWLYMLPSVVDDIDMGVTHVVRGEDHVTNTGVQLQMFAALGAPAPAFAHAPLLTGEEGKLSKRLGSLGLDELLGGGVEPAALLAYLGRLGTSLPVEPVGRDELVASFALDKVGRAQPRFSETELRQLSQRMIHALPHAAVAHRIPLNEAEWILVRPNLSRVDEAEDWLAVLRGPLSPPAGLEGERPLLAQALDALPQGPFDLETWSRWTGELATATGRRGRALFLPLRLALTGRERGPDMAALVAHLGRDEVARRLAALAAG